MKTTSITARGGETASRGMVLVVVVMMIAVLGVLVLNYTYLIHLDSAMASGFRDTLEADYLARSGIGYAMMLLAEDMISPEEDEDDEAAGDREEEDELIDHLGEEWARPRQPVARAKGEFIFTIIDEDRKFNVNSLISGAAEEINQARLDRRRPPELDEETEEEGEMARARRDAEERTRDRDRESEVDERAEETLRAIFEHLEISRPREVVKNIIDWIDIDDEGDSESDYYLSLDVPYPAKNGPLETIGELLLIKDIDREIFKGDFRREEIPELEDDPDPFFSPAEEEGFRGLRHYLTVYSDGKININTVSEELLEILLGREHRILARDIVTRRREEPFTEMEEVQEAAGRPIPSEILDQFKVNSDFFTVISEGRVGNITSRVRAVIQRHDGELVLLYWRHERG